MYLNVTLNHHQISISNACDTEDWSNACWKICFTKGINNISQNISMENLIIFQGKNMFYYMFLIKYKQPDWEYIFF